MLGCQHLEMGPLGLADDGTPATNEPVEVPADAYQTIADVVGGSRASSRRTTRGGSSAAGLSSRGGSSIGGRFGRGGSSAGVSIRTGTSASPLALLLEWFLPLHPLRDVARPLKGGALFRAIVALALPLRGRRRMLRGPPRIARGLPKQTKL